MVGRPGLLTLATLALTTCDGTAHMKREVT